VLGLLVGRWWTLLAAAGFGVWIGLREEVEVDGWWLGFGYSALSALGIVAGVLLRRFADRLAKRSSY
jgi:hypothetical protein